MAGFHNDKADEQFADEKRVLPASARTALGGRPRCFFCLSYLVPMLSSCMDGLLPQFLIDEIAKLEPVRIKSGQRFGH